MVLREPAPAEHLAPGGGQHQVRAVGPVIADEFVGPVTEQGGRQVIGEDRGLVVHDQVGGPGGGGHQGRLAGQITSFHAADNSR